MSVPIPCLSASNLRLRAAHALLCTLHRCHACQLACSSSQGLNEQDAVPVPCLSTHNF
jgi:hypothetical protein